MPKLEIICVIIGFIELFNSAQIKGANIDKIIKWVMLKEIVRFIVCGLMIIMPLYFRYWK